MRTRDLLPAFFFLGEEACLSCHGNVSAQPGWRRLGRECGEQICKNKKLRRLN